VALAQQNLTIGEPPPVGHGFCYVSTVSQNSDKTPAVSPAEAAAQLMALRSIVDDLSVGIVLLDQEQRVQFVNRAFRQFWRLSDAVAENKLTFSALLYEGRGANASTASYYLLGDYIAKQVDLIRSREERPLHIRLSNGEVLQFRCKTLPDGGRLLTYGNVSELVQQSDAFERLASVDAMTGVNNRRRFLELGENEWSRFKRYDRPLALLMIDIDRFKSINDEHGHDAGDQVIKAVASALKIHKRSHDMIGRLGGEEFALLLLEAALNNAIAAAERFRRLIADYVIVVDGKRIPVTISIGVSVARPEMSRFDVLLKQADMALYEAKRSGRDRVCRFDRASATPLILPLESGV
jgi:diguanylate cyclase (GGDEF)-like protein